MKNYLKHPGAIILAIVVGLITLLMLFPALWVVLMSLKTNGDIFNKPMAIPWPPRFVNYVVAFKTVNLLLVFKNTFFIAVCTVVAELVFNTMSSFALARMQFKTHKVQNLFYSLFLSGLVIPVFILMFPIYMITVKLHLINSFFSVILPYVGGAVSFNTLLMVGGMRNFPREIEEAAIIDGVSLKGLILRIMVPLLTPVLATMIIYNFLGVWNEYPMAVILLIKESMRTVALSVAMFRTRYSIDYASMTAGIVMLLIPQLLFYIIFQKYIIEGLTAGAVKG